MTESWRSPAAYAILDALTSSQEPMSLANLVGQGVGGLSRPGLYYNLQRLAQAGLVVRTGTQKNARYAPEERISVQWTARLGDRWKQMAWTCTPPISWRFPLTSRLESATSRDVTLQFLAGLEAELLHRPDAWMQLSDWAEQNLKTDPIDLVGLEHSGDPSEMRRAAYLHLTSHTNYGPCIVAVFGSSANGTNHASSDVDIFIKLPSLQKLPEDQKLKHLVRTIEEKIRLKLAEGLRDIVAEIDLAGYRPIDLHIHNEPGRPIPPPLLDAICREGVTVYTTSHHHVIERPEIWLHD